MAEQPHTSLRSPCAMPSIGWSGHVIFGVKVNSNREHLIYPLGCNIIFKRNRNVIIWDFAKRGAAHLQLHKIVGCKIENREAICGSPASAHSGGHCLTLQYSNTSDSIFELDLPHKITHTHTQCQTGQLKTIVKCIWIPEEGSYFYCGTSGDILKVSFKTKLLNGPWPSETETGNILSAQEMARSLCSGEVSAGGVTSIAPRCDGHQFSKNNTFCHTFMFVFLPVIDILCCFLSAWNDGKICGFTPETGRLMMTVHNAHSMGVSDREGQVKIKKINETNRNNRYTLVRSVCYHPEEYQIITSDTERKGTPTTTVYDGFALRELEGSLSGSINGMHITLDGDQFVTDTDGEVTDIGTGHSGSINSIKICSNSKYVISISVDGHTALEVHSPALDKILPTLIPSQSSTGEDSWSGYQSYFLLLNISSIYG
uniref:Uncharacterized protein n=1 Tax=Oncorhynchus mykiss TaxID=8022 RepID=A0A8C7RE54_ONCMY